VLIVINGENKEIVNKSSINKIIQKYNININNCLVELNGEALKKEDYQLILKEKDKLELIRFIGGG
jgi:thiamine biosynthesis protein ThiS